MTSKFLSLLLLLSASPSWAQAGAPDPLRLVERVRALADESLGGRGNGLPGAAADADSVAVWFSAAALVPAGEDGWFQPFSLGGEEHQGQPARNVVGLVPGRGALADRHVVIGAHYDHLGLRSDDEGRPAGFYPGAEDNASGVAAICEIASLAVYDEAADRRTLWFVAFAGEEIGLQGSRWFVDHAPFPISSLDLMVNLDSVGRLRSERLYIGGVGTAAELRGIVTSLNDSGFGFDLQISEGGWDASDHVSFNTSGIPVLFLFTGPHPQYHSLDDRWDLVEGGPLARVTAFAAAILREVALRPDPLSYKAVGDLTPTAPTEGGRKKRAWLGTIPDFVDDVQGVKLAGVMPGSPAEEAGLLAGDVVVGVGEVTIGSLQDLTVALQTHGEGETVAVVFVRDGERRDLRVTLRPRPR